MREALGAAMPPSTSSPFFNPVAASLLLFLGLGDTEPGPRRKWRVALLQCESRTDRPAGAAERG